ncbi:MAG: fructose-1,6-bisphosphatase [Bacteroidales bacterium]|nr:fructose-1,6-bisphosphatase [Bacteroidales bacterium]
MNKNDVLDNIKYLELLSKQFPNIAAASTEIINLEAINSLPKGTEHFLSDIHGEYEAFQHVLKNASGDVKRKVNEIFGDSMSDDEKKELCTLIYYPKKKLELIKSARKELEQWYEITLERLVTICRSVSSKYTRSKVRKALPPEFAYIIEELLHETGAVPEKAQYVNVIVKTIISTHRADDFIIALSKLIQRLIIDTLHIIGDVFDRGPGAHLIMELLCNYHNFDIQWGNHDILWMGAASGNDACMANVLRITMRYGNLSVIEDGYGINLLPLATFAMDTYADDPCTIFMPIIQSDDHTHNERTRLLIAQMHKAISIIQFKLEAEIISRRPEFEMENRKVLEMIDYENRLFIWEGKAYPLTDTFFPTIDPKNPSALTKEERELVNKLHHSFVTNEKLHKHIDCLIKHGNMYLVTNSNLLYHASVPLNADGSLKEVTIDGGEYKGRKMLNKVEKQVRLACNDEVKSDDKEYALDFMWYLWSGKDSPLYDKSKMATFERYFTGEEELHAEEKGAYYALRDSEATCDMILDEFGVKGVHRHIISGHVPVKTLKGENPVKAQGKMIVIDGGFSKPYHHKTGIAGYTLVYHSRGLQLVQHEPFKSAYDAVTNGTDIISTTQLIEMRNHRIMMSETDTGRRLRQQINDLKQLLYAYRKGFIKEQELS